jgi:hypothetical protein
MGSCISTLVSSTKSLLGPLRLLARAAASGLARLDVVAEVGIDLTLSARIGG